MHSAAFYGHLDQVPKGILTVDNILIKNNKGDTLLHLAARTRYLDQVLGTELSEVAKEIVGETWWNANQKILRDKQSLKAIIKSANNIGLF